MRTRAGGVAMSPMTSATAFFDARGMTVAVGVRRAGNLEFSLEAEDAELSPTGGEVGLGELANGFERHIFDYTV